MSRFVEQSADGSVLEWRPHDLEDVAALRGLPDLEPALLTGERALEGLLPTDVDHRGLRWSWSAWVALEMLPAGSETPVVRRAGEPAVITWQELGDTDAVEVTPRSADGAAGITRLIERPRPRVVFSPRDDLLVVRVEGAAASGRVQAELYELGDYKQLHATGDVRELKRRGADLEVVLDPGRSFFGVVAVLERVGARRRIMDWRSWVEGRLHGRQDTTIEANLRREVERTGPAEGARGSFAGWPRRSRERLEWIADRARWLAEGAGSERLGRITGAFRAVFLGELGIAPEKPSPGLAERLNDGPFLAALGRLWSGLPARFQKLSDAAARHWLLQHPEAPRGVVEDGGDDAHRLDRAQAAAGWQERLAKLAECLRDDCSERDQVDSLRQELRRYIEQGGSLGSIPTETTRLEQRLAREAARPPAPEDPPPLTRERFAAWLQLRSTRTFWRQGLVRIADYCQTGIWESDIPPPEAAPEEPMELRRRLGRITLPPPPRRSDTAVAEAVRREIDRLESGAAAEGDPELRREALTVLRNTVRPRAGDWAGLRRDLEEAERLRPTHPWLAGQIPAAPAGATLPEQGKAALRFLSLLDRIERQAAQGNGAENAADAQWRVVLETPDHPHLQVLLREIVEMRQSLSNGTGQADPDIPGPPILSDVEPEARLEAWWQYLEKLVPLHTELARRFAAANRDWEAYSPVLEPVRGAVGFWRNQLAAERPDYFVPLAELTDRAYAEGSARPQALARLAEFLASHPTITDDWHQAAARAAASARTAARAAARGIHRESEERA